MNGNKLSAVETRLKGFLKLVTALSNCRKIINSEFVNLRMHVERESIARLEDLLLLNRRHIALALRT